MMSSHHAALACTLLAAMASASPLNRETVDVAGSLKCPGSKAHIYASCQMTTTFKNACAEVIEEISARVGGQKNGTWHDPHNKGTYTIDTQTATEIDMHRLTGNNKYTDKQVLSFTTDSDGSCVMQACSQSQVTSIFDGSTNYCNLHDLYCSDDGCHVVHSKLTYHEFYNACAQNDATQCLKV